MLTDVGFVFTDVGFHPNSGFTEILCIIIFPLLGYRHQMWTYCWTNNSCHDTYNKPNKFINVLPFAII